MDQYDVVSIVLTTKNGMSTLPRTINSIMTQTWRNFELILIDNFSSDGTREFLSGFGPVYDCTGGLSYQLNLGFKLSKGNYILMIEQDQELTPNLLKECMNLVAYGIEAIVIPERRSGTYWVRSRKIEVELYQECGDVAARFFKKSLLKLIGGFDTGLTGFRDYDFGFKMRSVTKMYGSIKAELIGFSDDSLTDYVRKFYKRGSSLRTFATRHGTAQVFEPYLHLVKHPSFIFRPQYAKYLLGFSLLKVVELYTVLLSIATRRNRS